MNAAAIKALGNAAASSAMEGLPLNQEDRLIIQKILDGVMSLQEFLESLGKQEM